MQMARLGDNRHRSLMQIKAEQIRLGLAFKRAISDAGRL
jgi:hypothetical protein